MKTWVELTPQQQKKGLDKALNSLLESILNGVRFDDEKNGDDLQARIDRAADKAEAMQTPWFTGEYVLDVCEDDLRGIAQATAEDSLYSESTEYVINGVA